MAAMAVFSVETQRKFIMHALLRPTMLALLSAGAVLTAPLAMAATPWQAAHPARAQVLQRADRLDHRIAHVRWMGAISPWRAAALQRQVSQVRWRQDLMARRQGGDLVRSQWWALNRQEDAISREIAQ